MDERYSEDHIVSTRTYTAVWLALLVLLAATIAVSRLQLLARFSVLGSAGDRVDQGRPRPRLLHASQVRGPIPQGDAGADPLRPDGAYRADVRRRLVPVRWIMILGPSNTAGKVDGRLPLHRRLLRGPAGRRHGLHGRLSDQVQPEAAPPAGACEGKRPAGGRLDGRSPRSWSSSCSTSAGSISTTSATRRRTP